MATKTFKIGLSNTDKANMSQDIYERVEELLFNEYDPTSTYNTNDYVIYSSVLYRAIADNITGAWDSTKWQSATLNDLVDLVNGAVASVDGKANTEDLIDGSLVPNQSVFAKELIPVSEESGETQEEPFINQGTGTDNNTNPVDTGATAKQLEKQGNTIVYNQLAIIPTLTTRTVNGITFTNNGDGTVTIEGTATADTTFDLMGNLTRNVANHYYLISNFATPGSSTYHLYDAYDSVPNTYRSTPYWYAKQHSSSNTISPRISVKNGTVISTPQTVRVVFVDLTQWFNGDIPTDLINNPSHFLNYYNGELEYNLGELRSCNGRYLETTGRNLWDGTHDIRVIPTNTYYCYGSATLTYKDKEGTTISSETKTDETFEVPSGCYLLGVSGTDICISIYYTPEQGGEGYDQYYPYEQPKIYDTGTEDLLSTGVRWNNAHTARIDAHDIKRPDGTIIRDVGTVDLGTLNWEYLPNSFGGSFRATFFGFKSANNYYGKDNLLCGKYEHVARINLSDKNKAFASQPNIVFFKDTAYSDAATFKAAMSGVMLYYELEIPTTEQGTPFAENIEINDYGMMGWKDTNNNYVEVPQGCKIFYPAWYVGFIDSLGARVNWNADNIPLNSELNNKFLSFLTSITGYDDTKTQTLKNVTGTLTWVDD